MDELEMSSHEIAAGIGVAIPPEHLLNCPLN